MRALRTPSSRRAAALLVGLAIAASGCSSSGDLVWQPVERLVDQLETTLPPGVPNRCAVADEIRPALGCPRMVRVLRAKYPFPKESELSISARLPPALESGLVIVEPVIQGKEVQGWQETPPKLLEGSEPAFSIDVPLAGLDRAPELSVSIDGLVVPAGQQRFRTREILLGRRAALRVGVSVAPVAAQAGASPAEFVVTVLRPGGEEEEVLRTIVLPEESERGWVEQRVDLSRFEGERVRLDFASAAAHVPGREGELGFTLPLWGSPEILEPLPRRGQRNIVLVSLDTLRGDLVGANLVGREVTPELDRIASKGAKFSQTIAPYPSTTASHMSLFTSVYPAVHKVLHAKLTLPGTIPTLSEILAANSYQTAAVTEDGMLAAEAGFTRGFDDYYENKGVSMWDAKGDVEGTVDAAVRWLQRNRNTKFFLFVHTYQVHNPYEPPHAFDVFEDAPLEGQKPHIVEMRNRYAGEVRYTDSVLRSLFDTLERLGEIDHTIVVLTADHGEEFGEHGSVGHSQGVHDEVLHVPMILWAPGLIPPGVRIDSQVSLVDLAPTLLDLVHVKPPKSLQGESLAHMLRTPGDTRRTHVRFAEGPPLGNKGGRIFSARTDRYKWIARENDESTLEVYDLETDPEEKHNLDDPKLRAQGKELLAIYRQMDADSQAPGGNAVRDIDARTENKLRALGYLD